MISHMLRDIGDLVPHPDAVMIQTNTSCNLSCKFCFFGQKPGYDTGEEMATSTIAKILDDLARAQYRGRVSLYNINEPLTDPRLFDLLAMAKEKLPECEHKITTNGLLLDQDKLDRLTKLLDVLEISQYGRLPELDYSSPVVKVANKRNFIKRAGSNRGGNLIGLPQAQEVGTKACMNVLGQFVIDPPSTAILCCADGMKDIVIGDVLAEDTMRVWTHSPVMNEYRAKHAVGRRGELKLCSGCTVEGFGYNSNKGRRAVLGAAMVAIAERSSAT